MSDWKSRAKPISSGSWKERATPVPTKPQAEGSEPEEEASSALNILKKGGQQALDALVVGVDSIPGMGYLKKAQAAIAAPIKGQTYEETIAGYNQDIDDRWERSPGAALTGTVATNMLIPGPSGASAASRILQNTLLSGADATGRGEVGLNIDEGLKAGSIAGVVQAGIESLPYVGKGVKAVGNFTRDKVGSVGFGVRGDATQEYIKNPKQMRSTIDAGEDALLDLKNQVDDSYKSKVSQPLADAKSGYDEAVMDYADQKARLKNSRPPEEIAPELIDRVRGLDKGLSVKSGEAFEKLSDVSFDRNMLSNTVNEMKSKLMIDGRPPVAGDDLASWNALTKVEEMISATPETRDSLTNQIIKGSELKGADLKRIIQTLDQMSEAAYTTYGTRTAAGKIKGVRGGLNSVLTEAVPEYADAMAPLADETRLVVALKEMFGDEDKARAALRSTANPDTGRQVGLLLQSLDNKTGSQYAKMLQEYIDAQRMVRDPQGAQVLKAFTLNPAKRALTDAEETASKFSRLGAGSSENAIKSASRANNFETKKQLSELMGDDFLDSIKQYGLAQDFQKTSTNGSRKVNLGGIIGGPLGAVLGGATDIHGGQIWQKILDGQIKASELIAKVPPAYKNVLLEAEKRGPRALAATYAAIAGQDQE